MQLVKVQFTESVISAIWKVSWMVGPNIFFGGLHYGYEPTDGTWIKLFDCTCQSVETHPQIFLGLSRPPQSNNWRAEHLPSRSPLLCRLISILGDFIHHKIW